MTGPPPAPPPAATEGERWVQDVHWLARALRRWHPDLYASSGREAFHGEVVGLAERMPDLSHPDRVLGLMRVLAHVGDSHTRLVSEAAVEDPSLPFRVEPHADGYWIEAVQETVPELDTVEIIGVEGRTMPEVTRRLARLIPYENAPSLRRGVAQHLSRPRALVEVGVARSLERVRLRLRDRHGVEFDAAVEPVPAAELGAWVSTTPRRTHPQGFRPSERWWWEPIEGSDALYLQYNRCEDSDRAPYFADVAGALIARLDAGRGDLRLIVDLRHNGGGNSRVMRPLTDALAERSVQVVVLVGPGTYSSAVLNAWHLRERARAVLVGEPTGGKPNHFGELRRFRLPNSGLEVLCSTRSFELVEGDPPSLEPDLPVPRTFEDVLAGRDPALEAALGALQPAR